MTSELGYAEDKMREPPQSTINSAIITSSADIVTGRVLNATPTGTTDTAVLRFDNVTVPANSRLSAVTNAANGTIVTLQDAGIYAVDMTLAMTGAVTVDAGIGLNTTAAPIIADPVVGTDGAFKANSLAGVASLRMAIEFATEIYVDSTQLPARIRFLATDPFSGAPTGLAAGTASFRIVKTANFPF